MAVIEFKKPTMWRRIAGYFRRRKWLAEAAKVDPVADARYDPKQFRRREQ